MSQAPGMPGLQQGYGHGCQGRHGVSKAPFRPGLQGMYGHGFFFFYFYTAIYNRYEQVLEHL